MTGVPRIDIAPLLGALDGPVAPAAREVASQIDEACREVGFFSIVGHGVPADLRARLDRLAREFFGRADDEKAAIAMVHGGPAWRGWFPLGGELTSGTPDHKEGLYFGTELPTDDPRVVEGRPLHGPNLFPAHPADLRDAVLTYFDELTRLAQSVLGGMALGLGLPRTWFVEHLTTDPIVLFRIFHYPPTPPDDDLVWGVGEHTDYGLLTLLGQDGNPGLQVRSTTGWVDVDPEPDAFVCNIGDMLERLTGGAYVSTPHRARNTAGVGRLSFPFFLDPSWEAVVDRLPIVARPIDKEAAARWDGTSVHGFSGTYGDYLMGKVSKVFPDLASQVTATTDPPSPP